MSEKKIQMHQSGPNRSELIAILMTLVGIFMLVVVFLLTRQELDSREAQATQLSSAPGLITDFDTISDHVGQAITLEGCLLFACPEVLGAEYPRDCIVTVCDDGRECLNNLDLEASSSWRAELEQYYPLEALQCIPVRVEGTVVAHTCPGLNCTYSLAVADLSVSAPVRTPTAPPVTPTRSRVARETPLATVSRFPTPIPHPPYIEPDCDWAPLLAVNKGDSVTIQVVKGSWAVWGGPGGVRHRTDGTGYTGDDRPGSPLSSAPIGALIGRIGNSEPFYVGNENEFAASQSGTLGLRINDTMCGDNTGGLAVRLSVASPDDQSPQIVEPDFLPPDRVDATTLVRHQFPVNQVSFSPDGKTLAVASGPNIHLHETVTLAERHAIATETNVMSVAFSPAGDLLASGSHPDGAVRLWRVSDGALLHTLEGHPHGVWSVAFSHDGQTLASGSLDHTVRLWQTRGCEPKVSPGGVSKDPGEGGESTECGRLLHTLAEHPNAVTSVAFSPDRETLAVGVWDNSTVRLWQARSGELLNALQGGANRVTSLAFSHDRSVLASASQEGRVLLWQMPDGKLWQTLGGHPDVVYSVAFSPDGHTLAAGTLDNTVWLWRVSDGTRLSILDGGTALVTSVAFSPDGKTLATGSHDGAVQLWDLGSGGRSR